MTGQGKKCEKGRLYCRLCLGDDEQVAAVYTVNEDPCEGGKKKDRGLAGEAYKPEVKGGIRQTVHKPAHGYLLHPCPDKGDTLASEKKAVVPGMEGPSHKLEG